MRHRLRNPYRPAVTPTWTRRFGRERRKSDGSVRLERRRPRPRPTGRYHFQDTQWTVTQDSYILLVIFDRRWYRCGKRFRQRTAIREPESGDFSRKTESHGSIQRQRGVCPFATYRPYSSSNRCGIRVRVAEGACGRETTGITKRSPLCNYLVSVAVRVLAGLLLGANLYEVPQDL